MQNHDSFFMVFRHFGNGGSDFFIHCLDQFFCFGRLSVNFTGDIQCLFGFIIGFRLQGDGVYVVGFQHFYKFLMLRRIDKH